MPDEREWTLKCDGEFVDVVPKSVEAERRTRESAEQERDNLRVAWKGAERELSLEREARRKAEAERNRYKEAYRQCASQGASPSPAEVEAAAKALGEDIEVDDDAVAVNLQPSLQQLARKALAAARAAAQEGGR